ncbi:hypothetical protein DK926_09375 [Rhodococcus sp. Eu-32]|uniref:cell division protein PerM n=1 Tax=Rhodococcus sp. Eu-32 TaxID=1017319 RepID=UPI000DF35352|nr:DUF6350 family protein [Rhodococcus sp. Eu-32]RRQ28090.1 hypothetical protein DK926_09375 [Rhodococcus sp. Eu-32]
MSALLNDEKRRAPRTPRAPKRAPLLTPEESRLVVRIGFRKPGVLIAAIAAVVLITLVSANSELTGTFGAIAGMWFAVHQVPMTIGGTALGVLPLLPTLVLMTTVARGVAAAVDESSSRRTLSMIGGAAVLGPVSVTAVALAVAADASRTIGLSSPNALLAFVWVAAVHGIAAGIGIAMGTWHLDVTGALPEWVRSTLRPMLRAAMVLVAGAAGIVLASMLASWSTTEMLLTAGNGFVGVLGLTILSILYLPNVVLGALAVAVGSEAHVGDVVVSFFATTGGPVPPLPVLSVLPEGPAQSIWFLMLVVPLTAGILLGRDCAHRTVDLHYALSSVWLGSAVVGVATLLLGVAAGGSLGTFGTVQVTVWSLGLLTFAWLAVVGSMSAAITAWRGGSKQPAVDAEPEPARTDEPVAAIAAPVVHEERAVDAEVVAEADAIPSKDTASSNDTASSQDEENVVEAEVVEAEVFEERAAEETPEQASEDPVAADPEVVEAETTEDVDAPSSSDVPEK